MELKQAFGQALKQLRMSQGLTQEDFSDVSSRTYLSTLERGLKSPTIDKLDEIGAAMGIHPATILIYSYLLKTSSTEVEKVLDRIRDELQQAMQ
ncbi:TPA: helix-turn-helix transcriptional regulator [Pseudomonas aeruginosa]|jgi:transcriptional regulator with XRE-family HTH domain|uniref:Transcriptional regulator n=3 Tax=Pseudomonas TaxID=286 RepID=A0A241XHG1_PSEAI|nr:MULTISPECIES: helix-turn-helix transcriptional regulator [Pseudomonas]AMA40770.1 XRE family transcriptional regulator [Pseudomonas aeruginosa DHS01]AWR47572.1 XRE family transcriptional regulator [Pseudomonas aeruginosa]EIU5018787.1 helix-turn-helix transcriptional regulator [Pseudomonas aeruginosa]EIZ7655776.1 helix-turn-helix transcriptional regulator [Pseudomonas aeruginosa]EJC9822602.1 helix-turn-helix transcriptional regulator [Pseudomonas aeruginosa]